MKKCSVKTCENNHFGHGYCFKHYARNKKYGSPLGGQTAKGALPEWIEKHINYSSDECLIWPFATTKGYGMMHIDGKSLTVSRVICERRHGQPPTPKHQAAHSCGKGHLGCVSPVHVRWATRKGNESDKFLHGTSMRGKNSKLTVTQVLEIKHSTLSNKNLGAKHGVCPDNIRAIRSGRSWAWLT